MKKSIIFIFAFLFISAFTNAQITITPYFQGDFANTTDAPIFRPIPSPLQEVESAKLSYTSGVSVNYTLNEKWSINSGLRVQEMGSKIYRAEYLDHSPFPGTELGTKQNITFQFISIPIQLQYNFRTDKKIQPFVALGTGFNWNTNSYLSVEKIYHEAESRKEKLNFKDDIRSLNLEVNLTTGVEFLLKEKLRLKTFFSGNSLLLTIQPDETTKDKHYNIGLGIGLGYTI